MLLINSNRLGESALNKMAEFAFASQINTAEQLTVRVKTNPGLLAQGELESLHIDGVGLVMRQDLRLEQMQLQMTGIRVKPFKALLGNIELAQPSHGRGCMVLTDQDFQGAFHSPDLGHQLTALGYPHTEIHTQLQANGTLNMTLSGAEIPATTWQFLPTIRPNGGVLLTAQSSIAPALQPLAEVLRTQGEAVFNLRRFELKGLKFIIAGLTVQQGLVTLEAIAAMTEFPA
ncbi:DUF2993 domain-containing protein [Spirulina sp. CCNP1310]|uniref:LmeA family phospholipid-binding protein n=1 Tax=Spirulina sp. CCNP1310 TaxID=3110249 RepID=UPI002B206156|nr:DUF2993 domain-containing protein [Spirulina sp. CCNP1310]MEA5419116.1 DUF2993 domain-containing protein [Spirulina sp. CCNP1310]